MLYILFLYLLKKTFEKFKALQIKNYLKNSDKPSFFTFIDKKDKVYPIFYQYNRHWERFNTIKVNTLLYRTDTNIKAKDFYKVKKKTRLIKCRKILNTQIYTKYTYKLNLAEMYGLPFKKKDLNKYLKYIWRLRLKKRIRRLRKPDRPFYSEKRWHFLRNPHHVYVNHRSVSSRYAPNLPITVRMLKYASSSFSVYVWQNLDYYLITAGIILLIWNIIEFLIVPYLENLTLFHIVGYLLLTLNLI